MIALCECCIDEMLSKPDQLLKWTDRQMESADIDSKDPLVDQHGPEPNVLANRFQPILHIIRRCCIIVL